MRQSRAGSGLLHNGVGLTVEDSAAETGCWLVFFVVATAVGHPEQLGGIALAREIAAAAGIADGTSFVALDVSGAASATASEGARPTDGIPLGHVVRLLREWEKGKDGR